MGGRAEVRDTGLPRYSRRCTLLVSAAAVAWLTGTGAGGAQSLFDPYPATGPAAAPTFGQGTAVSPGTPGRFRRVPSEGSAPPPGAGATGFISVAPPDSQLLQEPEPLLPGDAAAETIGTTVVEAEDPFVTPAPSRRPPRRRPEEIEDPYEPLGLRLGSFVVKPAIEISGGYDSNPERETQARGNGLLVVSPELQVRSDWSRHELRADIRGRYRSYPGFDATPSVDQPFIDSRIAARIDVTRRTRIELEGRFQLSTEDPNSPDLPAGLARLPITMTGGGTAGVVQQFNRLEIGVSGSFDRTTYNDSVLTDGQTISNDDRNYNQYGAKLRGSYELVPGIKPFVEVGADQRVYDLPVDASGQRRDSTGNEVRAGTTFEFARQLVGTASIGYATREYQDPTLRNIDGLVADGELIWSATPLTKVTTTVRSRIAETTLTGVSGILRHDFAAQVDHSFRHWLIGTLKFEYGIDDYVGSPRVDQRYAISGVLTYKLSRNAQLKGEIRRQWLESNAPGASYVADIYLLGIRLQQ
jgi:hypothetical protein